jgi:hypothetical protein
MISHALLMLLTVVTLSSQHGQDADPSGIHGLAEKRVENTVKTQCSITLSSPVDGYGWDDADMPILVTIVNCTGMSVQLDKSSLVGITINGVGNTYNFNKHLSPRPGETVTLPSGGSIGLRINLKSYWQKPEPPAGSYGVTLRYLIDGTIQASNELLVEIRK